METQYLPLHIEKADSADYDARFVLSAATPDRVKDTIDPKAYEPATKIDKLIALFNHNPDQIAGYWTDITRQDDTLTGHIKFMPSGVGAMLKEMLDFGVPLGASIGFRGKGKRNDKGGIHFDELEVLETSLVSVPAHRRAMQIAKSYGVDIQSIELSDAEALSAASGTERDPERVAELARKAILKANQTLRMQT